ncbi:MAG: Hsp20/alpha crystallin family protein [Bryobacterales bacterium]|nr:Hsp20/alpha crystallin family protein [Bryobacterales bacterium]
MSPRRVGASLLFYASNVLTPRDSILRPATDVYSTRTGWLVKMELAGVRPDDVAIHIHANVIEIHGSRRDTTCDEITGHYKMEIAYQQFSRVVELPDLLEARPVSVEFRDGMLLLRVRRNEVEK